MHEIEQVTDALQQQQQQSKLRQKEKDLFHLLHLCFGVLMFSMVSVNL
jgi:hypothetical protein